MEPASVGQIHANTTLWNGVACPNAKFNLAYFNKKGSNVALTRSIEPTDSYTVEFWFKIPKGSTLKSKQDETYLFTMSEGSATTEAMTIYIDKSGALKCAPFGMTGSKSTVLTYSGIKPFNTEKWQHVTCAY